MKKRPIWIDCDPGIDDAVMLAMAAASRDTLEICGITSVAGNQSTDLVTDNALTLACFLGMGDVPVARGARKPLVRTPEIAGHIHGANGLGNAQFPAPAAALVSEDGVRLMRDAILALPEGERMTLVPTGPLTNIATLLTEYPEVKEKTREIVMMGGSSVGGNVTPRAEFNIHVDPEAAEIVYNSGLPIVMAGLDVTGSSGVLPEQVKTLEAEMTGRMEPFGEMLHFYRESTEFETVKFMNVHDATTILYLNEPDLFTGKQVSVHVICEGSDEDGVGETVCTDDEAGNVFLLTSVDTDRMQVVIMETIRSLNEA